MTKRDKLLTFSALALLLTAGYPALAQDDNGSGAAAPQQNFGHDGQPQVDGPPDGEPPKDGPPSSGGPRCDGPMGDNGRRGAEMFAESDTNKDGFLSKEEMLNFHKERVDDIFEKADTNHDGKLSPEEMRKGLEMMRAKQNERKQKMCGKNFRDRMMERRNGEDGNPGPAPSTDAPTQ